MPQAPKADHHIAPSWIAGDMPSCATAERPDTLAEVRVWLDIGWEPNRMGLASLALEADHHTVTAGRRWHRLPMP